MTITLFIFLAIYAALFVFRRTLGTFLSVSGTVVVALLHVKYGINPPIPFSVFFIYALFILVAAGLYILASEQTMREFWAPIRETIVNPQRKVILAGVLVVVPVIVGWRTYYLVRPVAEAPARFRVVHPAPPGSITAHGESFDSNGVNPLRALEETDEEAFKKHVWQGRRVYYENCYFCHGDELAADGHFASALQPRPISFRDTTTIAMFTEMFLFWRVAKGGPGLPNAATPWDSAMPAWEDFLTNEEMWQVILYLYDRTNQAPRRVEEHH